MSTGSVVILVLVAAGAGALAVAFLRYTLTPAFAWKARVVVAFQDLHARFAALERAAASLEATYAGLAGEWFARHLRTIPISRLAAFSGIGPVTIGRLQEIGYATLADLFSGPVREAPDIGPARMKAILAAVEALVLEARARFDAGACPEAVEYRRAVDALRLGDRDHQEKQARERVAVEAALRETFDLLSFARDVTFLKYLRRLDQSHVLAAVIARPLPQPREAPPAGAAPPAATPPAVPPRAASLAAEPTPEAFTLAPSFTRLPVAPAGSRPPPALPPDLFRAALDAPAGKAAPESAEPPGLAKMRALIALGFVVARIDGRVVAAERKAIRAYLESTFGHDAVLRRNIDPLMERIGKTTPTEAEALAAVRAAVPPADRPAVFSWAEQIVASAGKPNKAECDLLARVRTGLDLGGPVPAPPTTVGAPPPAPRPAAAAPPPPPAAPDHRAVLELPADGPLDPDLIRRRFQNLTDKLDPARAAAFGPEFARMAEEKRGRVRAAAEALIAPSGEPLEKPAPPPPADLRHNPDLDDVFGA